MGYNRKGIYNIQLITMKTLILIDIQKIFKKEELFGGNRNNKDAEIVCGKVLHKWRELGWDIIHVRHQSDNFSGKGFEYDDNVQPINGEIEIVKNVNSAFIGTELDNLIKNKDIVIVGLTTNHCVSTTVRMAGNMSYNVELISDATACFDRGGYSSDLVQGITLANLDGEFATIITSKEYGL